ncbi:hypothetical protein Droror1_Dr00020708 [Drosera rotundifolia]
MLLNGIKVSNIPTQVMAVFPSLLALFTSTSITMAALNFADFTTFDFPREASLCSNSRALPFFIPFFLTRAHASSSGSLIIEDTCCSGAEFTFSSGSLSQQSQ